MVSHLPEELTIEEYRRCAKAAHSYLRQSYLH